MNNPNHEYDPYSPPIPAPVDPERWQAPPDDSRTDEAAATPRTTLEEATLPDQGRVVLQEAPSAGDDPATLREAALVDTHAPAGPQLPSQTPALVTLPESQPVQASPGNQAILQRLGEETIAWLKTLASAAVYATLIVTFGFQVARVEGQSMAPTLSDQDRLIVNKFAYRIGEPQVGDIVMLYYPNNPEKSFVKRVIAEESDQVRIVNGRVYRNDVLVNDDYVPAEYRSHDDWGPEVIPEGYYFVMGDHRNNSSDSRHWRFVPKKYIIGKVQVRWWPLPEARIF
jgi:signal peptidase I